MLLDLADHVLVHSFRLFTCVGVNPFGIFFLLLLLLFVRVNLINQFRLVLLVIFLLVSENRRFTDRTGVFLLKPLFDAGYVIPVQAL